MQAKFSSKNEDSEQSDQIQIEAVCLNRVIFTLIVFQLTTVVEMIADTKLSESVIRECK